MKKTRRLLALVLTAAMLASVSMVTAVSANTSADPLYAIYTNAAYLVDSTDLTSETEDRFNFWDYDYGNRSAYNDIGGEGYGVIDKVWSSTVTKQKVLDEPIALGEGAIAFSFDAYVKDFTSGTVSFAVDTNPDKDWTTNEIYTTERYFLINMEDGNIGLGHSSGGSDTNSNAAMTALWGQGRTPFGEDGAWKHYDFVVDMVYGYTAVYCEGELILKAAHPIESFTAFQLNSRNNNHSETNLYLDNYALYRIPASALKVNTADNYKLAENRIDYSIGVLGSAGTEGTEADFWTMDLNHYPRYKTAADAANNAFYQGELDAGLPPVLYGSVEAAAYGSHYPVKVFSTPYKNGEGVFTFSYDYFASATTNKILYLEAYEESAPTTGYNTAPYKRIFAQDSGKIAVGYGAATSNATGVVDMPYGQWYHMDVVVDMISNKITVYCDNEVLVSADAELDNLYALMAEMKNRDGNSCATAFYLDNFTMYWTEPSFSVEDLQVAEGGVKVTDVATVAKGDIITASVALYNTTAASKDCVLLLAVYNGDELADVKLVPTTVAGNGGIAKPSVPITVADNTNLSIKAFLWDSLASGAPTITNLEL